MADETNVLDQLVGQIADDALRTRLAREIELLRGSRRFGLVFDRHLPESVRLPDHPIRKGVRVTLRDESTTTTWRVARFTDTSHTVAVLDVDGGERPVAELVVVRESGEPVFPGLQTIERIANGPVDAPWHTVINGENFHALQALRSTHGGEVDLIYIDPPYNTGNEGWIYNDRYVDNNDRAKSSKWLSFLERRLRIARELLRPTGVVIVAIGEEEHHRLRMLMDQVFGAENFLASVVWIGSVKNDARFTGGGLDYMLIYGRDVDAMIEADIIWREPKDGLQDVLDAGARAWEESGHDAAVASRLLSGWWSRSKGKYDPGLGDNVKVDSDGTVIKVSDLRSPNPRPNLRYDILHPDTDQPVRMHPNGWVYTREAMQRLIDDGRVLFGADHTAGARKKTRLAEMSMQSVRPRFYRDRRAASKRLETVLGDRRFPFPKDHEVLMRWFGIAAPKDAVILDFFGGSGTTTEAVVRLNAQDGGSRRSILVTNNEVGAKQAKAMRKAGQHPGDPEWESRGVFEYVCRPRIHTVVTGTREDGSTYSDGLAANVEMFDLTYLDPGMVRRGREFEAIAPLLWLEAGAEGDRIDAESDRGWALTPTYGVLFVTDALNQFATALAEAAKIGAPPRIVFIVTDSPVEYQTAGDRIPAGIETVRLYQDYLSNYTINVEGGTR
ncbi:site-specific DNA-methyltransferase [Microbacterium sp.]|uniref:site-specific DNA-methyltransferase n=1 Tax=Microbacterium sp. TaxID=51671 RepID=UPI0027360BD7|nr:site-specific DNA-methyltransferase [Microbacterium sp.]MDP3950094.1 site-specific DNA-methyltransferase [Microbacterium sp.]